MHSHLIMAGLSFDFSTLPEQLLNGILLGAIYALIALGYTMVYGVLKLINFAHGDVYMLGAYFALFGSYFLGFSPDATNPQLVIPAVLNITLLVSTILLVAGIVVAVGSKIAKGAKFADIGFSGGLAAVFLGGAGFLVCKLQPQAVDMLLMILGAMLACALIGVIIERFAYRPIRSHSRVAALITAIGVSLLIEYGGSLFLPNSPPPSIKEQLNPYRAASVLTLASASPILVTQANAAKKPYDDAQAEFNAYLQAHPKEDQFNTDATGTALKEKMQAAQRTYGDLTRKVSSAGVRIHYQTGQVLILIATLVLMIIFTYLVMFTKSGRAMRAVSHDFDSASLMGVNVNRIIVYTFVLGSALAGAGAMMQATVLGTPLQSFMGLLPGVKAFVAAVLGGIGNIPGAVLGGLLMGLAETLATWMGGSEYKDAIAFVILILVLLFKPGGLLGSAKVEKV
ncbi:MAG TPA: branched-chain amino acid ABC transporter permease [Fimbriimonadaceae bacterium]|jgi:branched-chain amino acid transport system permease protein